jgi:hypothetical protein
MRAEQWTKWLSTDSGFRGAVAKLLSDSGAVDHSALTALFRRVANCQHRVHGTRLMLTMSYCAWW